MLVFNNGGGRPGGQYSSVDEIVLPVDPEGRYARQPGKPFGPSEPVWSYTAPKRSDFFAAMMSGAQRLRNGNTLVSTGFSGSIFEVTPANEVVWKYVVPMDSETVGGPLAFFSGPGNPIFRAYHYPPDYPGLANRDLTPGKTIEEIQRKDVPSQ